MKRCALALSVACGLIFASSATATTSAKWLSFPTCSATTTTLTCAGSATGVRSSRGRPPLVPMIFTQAHYTCAENPDALGYAPNPDQAAAFGAPVHNGRRFTVSFTPPQLPVGSLPSLDPAVDCPSGNWTREPDYRSVDVGIGENELAFVLYANIGPVEAGAG
jgi:hypothetical protein